MKIPEDVLIFVVLFILIQIFTALFASLVYDYFSIKREKKEDTQRLKNLSCKKCKYEHERDRYNPYWVCMKCEG